MTFIDYLLEQNRKALVRCEDWLYVAILAAFLYWLLPL